MTRAASGYGACIFTLAQHDGRWWFITPEGAPFISIGLNHIDLSPLRYAANGER